MKKLIPPVLTILTLILMILLHLIWPVRQLLPYFLRWLGILPLLFGLLISISSSRRFSREDTEINTFKQPGKLITDGWFRFSRNPMYLGMVLITMGTWIALGSLSPVIGTTTFFLIADRWYVPIEEHALLTRFGQTYLNYKQHVRRWI